MSLLNPIGGYFELELPVQGAILHDDAIFLNSGRACFEYILRANKITKVYIPKYTCDVMLEPLKKLNISYDFYTINKSLEIKEEIALNPNDYLMYVNYFGVKDKYCHELASRYGSNLILDYSQALFSDPIRKNHTLYSPRKFFGLPDGGILYTPTRLTESLPQGVSYGRMSHLLKRLDLGAEQGYEDYKINDDSLRGEPMSAMSQLTKSLLAGLNFEDSKARRIANFDALHKVLKSSNELDIDDTSAQAPLCYPYYIDHGDKLRDKLINNKVFVATYWPNVFNWCTPEELEYVLAENIVPLPIDQRYEEDDMKRIIKAIYE